VKSDTDDAKSRVVILDAAERIFATHGYDGASMRLIAKEAGVAQALLHYHFKTKEQLYQAIFRRRSTVINAYREARLQKLFNQKKKPTLEELIEVFQPSSETLFTDQHAGGFFAPMVSAISIGQDDRSKSLMEQFYDPIALRFIACFRQMVPGLSEASAVWAYLFALGARMQTNLRNDRAGRLSRSAGEMSEKELHEAYKRFVTAGVRAMADFERRPIKKVRSKKKVREK
jgi:AcrR family transcriptional regulator